MASTEVFSSQAADGNSSTFVDPSRGSAYNARLVLAGTAGGAASLKVTVSD